jgi:anti-sigma regulatory factor (Ser/Thr protein kinase)
MRHLASFEPDAASVVQARRFIEMALMVAGCTVTTVETAVLLVSELATNAVVHARTPFSVELCAVDDDVAVEVSDVGLGEPVILDPSGKGGHGLRLVASLASDWGVRPERLGKTVFFRLPC